MMECENVEINPVSENVEVNTVSENVEENLNKQESISNHTLGLQNLYKAAFNQEEAGNYNNFHNKNAITGANVIDDANKKYFGESEKAYSEENKTEILYKNSNFDESYHLYSLKELDYPVDFVKSEEHSLDLNSLSFEEVKVEEVKVLTTPVLSQFDGSFQNETNAVLNLDKGIQIHVVKADGTLAEVTTSTTNSLSPITYNYENCEYTGDTQILQRYLSDSTNVANSAVATVTLNFVNKQNNNVSEKALYDSETVGVNPEMLGVRFEDCDFNSSDSFASTESIIPKNIQCMKCPKKFMFKSDLLRHDKYKHSKRRKLLCKYCDKEFVSQQNLLFHEKSHKRKRNSFKCEICKKVFRKSEILVNHMTKKHSSNTSFSCSYCGKILSSQILLNSHIKKLHSAESEKPFKCDICSKSFEKKQGLSCHAKAHLDEHPYVCQYCNKAFSKICYLKNHLRCHQEEKEGFVCDTCGKDCKTASALDEHNRKHTGEKPFTCNICMKSFAHKAYFKVHIKKHAEVKPFSCSGCKKTFVTLMDLNKHEKSHMKEKPYHCDICNQHFSQQSSLMTHWKKQKCKGNKSQEVYTQTLNFTDATDLQNVTIQNVNLIVDEQFANQQPIVLTSIGSLINSNSVPVTFTQNPSGPFSVSSIT